MSMRTDLSSDNAMRQAPATIQLYMNEGIKMIDASLGEGYAKRNPELLAAFLIACAHDFHSSTVNDAVYAVTDELEIIGNAVGEINL